MNTYIPRAAVHFLKIKNVLVLCLLFQLHLLRAQEKPAFAPGKIQLTVAFSLIPVNKTDAQLRFRYIDGPPAGAYPPDTISAGYRLQRQRFGQAIKVGIGYFVKKNLRASFSVTPQLAAFKSNKAKNTNVYGVQFDVGLDYFAAISKKAHVSFGTTASRIIGGFGITSGGAKNKPYLAVNGNELHDNDIGFHIIDTQWAASPRIGLHYHATNKILFSATSGFQMTFGRGSRLNFAGLQKDGTVKWNRKNFTDADVNLTIDETKITPETQHALPYRFSGLFFELGTTINLK